MLINVPVSIGELFDKISILDIKTKKIKNKDDLKLIKYDKSSISICFIQDIPKFFRITKRGIARKD